MYFFLNIKLSTKKKLPSKLQASRKNVKTLLFTFKRVAIELSLSSTQKNLKNVV